MSATQDQTLAAGEAFVCRLVEHEQAHHELMHAIQTLDAELLQHGFPRLLDSYPVPMDKLLARLIWALLHVLKRLPE